MSKRTPHKQPISSLELKFLLRLLMFPHYRTRISQIRPTPKTSAAERDRLCRQLQKQGLVDCEETVTRFGLTAAGQTLLTLDTSVLPITPDEQFVLKSGQKGGITPGQIHPRVPKNQRQPLIIGLTQRGLLKVTQRQIGEVWLTMEGQRFLRHDCAPQGNAPILSWTLLSSYLQFIRQPPEAAENSLPEPTMVTSDDLCQMIMHLDAVLQTENYLPIYHLRKKLQPTLSRQTLDQQLYELQREDRIDLSTLQDVTCYHPEEVAAGIPQDIGGPLFFISVV
ncbi:MAG: hypothetical protein F6K42_01145 [Leptolyngbya sp. SIO1D8]|nr:hypothetical protein [Leptolyngbya sp. SIO1D8]